MNLDRNICNAVKVLHETYVGVEKLLNFVREKADEYGYVSMTPDILLWRSKKWVASWLTSKFTVLFQRKGKNLLPSGWYDDDIFGMEICFDVPEESEAALYITRLCYEGDREGLPFSYDWYFTHPKWDNNSFKICRTEDGLIISEPLDDRIKTKFKGLKQAFYKRDTFSDITSENVKEKVFAVMDELTAL